jgi:uncharacterized protein (TIGR03437 family)
MRRPPVVLLWSVVWGCAFGQTYTISTIAGGGLPVNIPGTSGSLGLVSGVAIDPAGNVFIASSQYQVVLRLDAKTSILTLVAGNGTAGFSGDNGPATRAQLNLTSQFFGPAGLAVDSAGNLYIADESNLRVRKVSNGVITTVAGNGSLGPPTDNGLAVNAQFFLPISLAVDSAGNLYVADGHHLVRRVSNGAITTVAGTGTFGSSGDNGPATSAQFLPNGVAVDSSGTLYIADEANGRIRKVSNGTITTVAGGGSSPGDNGPATSAQVLPNAVAVDSTGNIYIADNFAQRIRKVSNGVITTVAGGGSSLGDNGPATSAGLSDPLGVAVDSSGNLYIADQFNNRIRKVMNGVITTVAGGGSSIGDNGPATGAQLASTPGISTGIAVDSVGNVYITDYLRARKVSKGVISTVAGNGTQGSSGDNGPAGSAQLTVASSAAVDSSGNLYISDGNRLREVSNGTITTVAGGGPSMGDNIPAASAELSNPGGVAVDPSGNLYISDAARVREISNGIINTVAGNGTNGFSGDNGPGTSAQLSNPAGVAVDSSGNLYISEMTHIRKISKGVITTVVGGGASLGDNVPATSAALIGPPAGIAVDSIGNLYLADQINNRIRKVSNGVITTVAGSGTIGFSGDNGPAATAGLSGPSGVAVDSSGRVYFADTGNNRIRVLVPDCTFKVSSSSIQSASLGSNSPITIQTEAFCLWTISGLPGWITLSAPPPGAGPADVSLVIAANTGAFRLATLLVAGQPIMVTQAAAPGFGQTISLVANASGDSPTIAPNMWVEIKGSNLAPAGDARVWQGSDFVNNEMPTVLDGVSVTMNGKNAYVYYISANQINILTPPDLTVGPVQVTVTVGGVTSAVFTIQAQQYSLSFFVFNGGPYVAATHSDSSLIGPVSLYPGLTTPAKPGAVIVLYANGFGPTSPPVASGSVSQTGSLPVLPVVKIGGVSATVQFAGLVSPGLYQFNVVVPASAPDGDNAVTATYNGTITQAGTLLTIQH